MTPEQEMFVREMEANGRYYEPCIRNEDALTLCAIIREQEAWIKKAREIVQAFADHVEDEMIVLWEGLTIDDVSKLLEEQPGGE